MCRSIRPLQDLAPPATDDEVAAATRRLLGAMVTTAPPRDRAVQADKARTRAAVRHAR